MIIGENENEYGGIQSHANQLYLAIHKGEELNGEMVALGVKRAESGANRVLNDGNAGLNRAGSLLGKRVEFGGDHQRMKGGDHHEIQVLEPLPVLIALALDSFTQIQIQIQIQIKQASKSQWKNKLADTMRAGSVTDLGCWRLQSVFAMMNYDS